MEENKTHKEKYGSYYYVYMIQTQRRGTYVGYTKNYIRRWTEHYNGHGADYIKKFGFLKPVYLERFHNISDAMIREKNLKKIYSLKKRALDPEFSDNIITPEIIEEWEQSLKNKEK